MCVRTYVRTCHTAAIHYVLPTLFIVMAAVGECHGLNHSSHATLSSYLRCKKSLHKTAVVSPSTYVKVLTLMVAQFSLKPFCSTLVVRVVTMYIHACLGSPRTNHVAMNERGLVVRPFNHIGLHQAGS